MKLSQLFSGLKFETEINPNSENHITTVLQDDKPLGYIPFNKLLKFVAELNAKIMIAYGQNKYKDMETTIRMVASNLLKSYKI